MKNKHTDEEYVMLGCEEFFRQELEAERARSLELAERLESECALSHELGRLILSTQRIPLTLTLEA